jgi:hypothetical protein
MPILPIFIIIDTRLILIIMEWLRITITRIDLIHVMDIYLILSHPPPPIFIGTPFAPIDPFAYEKNHAVTLLPIFYTYGRKQNSWGPLFLNL